MDDLPSYPDRGDNTKRRSAQRCHGSRWKLASGIAVSLALVVVLVVLHATGVMGPGQH